jgi:hypothetical protein
MSSECCFGCGIFGPAVVPRSSRRGAPPPSEERSARRSATSGGFRPGGTGLFTSVTAADRARRSGGGEQSDYERPRPARAARRARGGSRRKLYGGNDRVAGHGRTTIPLASPRLIRPAQARSPKPGFGRSRAASGREPGTIEAARLDQFRLFRTERNRARRPPSALAKSASILHVENRFANAGAAAGWRGRHCRVRVAARGRRKCHFNGRI